MNKLVLYARHQRCFEIKLRKYGTSPGFYYRKNRGIAFRLNRQALIIEHYRFTNQLFVPNYEIIKAERSKYKYMKLSSATNKSNRFFDDH